MDMLVHYKNHKNTRPRIQSTTMMPRKNSLNELCFIITPTTLFSTTYTGQILEEFHTLLHQL